MEIRPDDPLLESEFQSHRGIYRHNRVAFHKELEKALKNRTRVSTQDQGPQGIGDFCPIVPSILAPDIGHIHDEGKGAFDPIHEAEKGLDLLESYCNALADTSLPIEQISPIARALEQKAQELKGLMESTSEEGPLGSILNNIGIVTMVEALKFQRGDLFR